MGVLGWNRVLTEYGYLPDNKTAPCCSVSLWNEEHTNRDSITGSNDSRHGPTNVEFYFQNTTSITADTSTQQHRPSKYVRIKHGSEFHVDGYGLCYHIIETAYARHMNSVLHSKMNHVERPCARASAITGLSTTQARQLNPNFAIPNKLIHEVTKEFVQTIQQCHITMTVYWDGPQRHIHKYATDKKRNIERNGTFDNLHQYCENGTLPNVENNRNNKLCQYMLNNFPSSKLYMTQIYHTLHVQKKIGKVECVNEADSILAHKVQFNPNAYILGFDSDFCFFDSVQYIPIPTMQIHKENTNPTKCYMVACVITREGLASALHLPDSNAMIEVAILLGNDYIDPTMTTNNHRWNNDHINAELFPKNKNNNTREYKISLDVILMYLQNQVRGFQLTSSNPEVEQTVQFIRQVYNLQEQHQPSDNVITATDVYDQGDLICTLKEEMKTSSFGSGVQRPHITDDELEAMDITIPPQQQPSSKQKSITMKDIILRSIRNYIRYTQEEDEGFDECINITEDHLMALEQLKLKEGQSYGTVDQILSKLNIKNWRPSYDDTCVVYLIEKIIIHIIENNIKSMFIQLNSPFMIFDPYKYYVQLLLIREGKNIGYVTTTIASPSLVSATTASTPKIQSSTTPKQTPNGGGKSKNKSKKSKNQIGTPSNNNSNGNLENTNGINESMLEEEDEKEERKVDLPVVQAEPRPVLPVDEFEHKIIKSVYENRVTIIQGETGCGKLLSQSVIFDAPTSLVEKQPSSYLLPSFLN